MRLLANENVPVGSVRVLRQAGPSVAAVIEDAPGATDSEVMTRAVREDRIILTFDRDYGEIVYRLGLPAPIGIVYFRSVPRTPDEPAQQLLSLLSTGTLSLTDKFTVIERDRVRQRPLPR